MPAPRAPPAWSAPLDGSPLKGSLAGIGPTAALPLA